MTMTNRDLTNAKRACQCNPCTCAPCQCEGCSCGKIRHAL
jgi:hypothetical protein